MTTKPDDAKPDPLESLREIAPQMRREGGKVTPDVGTSQNSQAPPKCERCRFEHNGDDCVPVLAWWISEALKRIAFLNDAASGRTNNAASALKEELRIWKALKECPRCGYPLESEPPNTPDLTEALARLKALEELVRPIGSAAPVSSIYLHHAEERIEWADEIAAIRTKLEGK